MIANLTPVSPTRRQKEQGLQNLTSWTKVNYLLDYDIEDDLEGISIQIAELASKDNKPMALIDKGTPLTLPLVNSLKREGIQPVISEKKWMVDIKKAKRELIHIKFIKYEDTL